MNNPLYIVIAGKKQVGKNTTASFLENCYKSNGKTVTITSFAEPLKDFCANVFGLDRNDMETEEGKQKLIHIKWEDLYRPAVIQDWVDDRKGYMTIRELLQYFGSNICRNRFYNNIWSDAPFKRKWNTDVVIIADCRFPNEWSVAKYNDAYLIKITRPNIPLDNHISETALDNFGNANWDYIIDNERLLIDLNYKICEIYKGMKI